LFYCTGLALGLTLALAPRAEAASRTWTGAAGDGQASTAGNWSPSGAPTNTDDIVLDSTSPSNLTWDAAATNVVASWTQATTYGGTATVATLYAAQGTFTNVTVTGNLTVNGGVLTHGDNSTYGSGNTERYRLALTVGGDLTVGSGGRIDGDARGYAVGQGTGAGNSYLAAASHGGQGGKYAGVADASYAFRNTYGSIRTPMRLGSGGGEAGSGGGSIQLTVGGATTVDGMILACGGRYRSGGNLKGGSGGSIWLRTGTLGGSGIIEASGGSPNRGADSSPGGGRVAVVITNGSSMGSVACLAYGGAGTVDDVSHRGAAGTVYIETTNNAAGGGRLIVDNNNVANGQWTGASTLPAEAEDLASFAKVIVTNAGILAIGTNTTVNFGSAVIEGGGEVRIKSTNLVTFPGTFVLTNLYRLSLDVPVTASGNWTIANGGVLTHAPVHFANVIYSGTVDPPTKLYLTLNGDLTVQSGGRIDVDGKGNGYTRGIGWQSGASQGGAAHGGEGGVNTPPRTGRTTYGSIREPYFHGSCGDHGAGGGVVRLVVSGATTIDGTVSANAASTSASTNGTGGSVWIRTGTLGGSGVVEASSGQDTTWQPCGSGGRIAVTVTNDTTSGSVVFRAGGGNGLASWGYPAINGAAGTIYKEFKGTTPGKGRLLIDNNNLSCRYNNANIAHTVIEAASSNTPTLLRPALVAITNRAQARLNGNMSAEALSIYSDSYLDLAGRTGTVSSLTITNKSFGVGTYTTNDLGSLVTDSSGGNGRIVVAVASLYVDDTGVNVGPSGTPTGAVFRVWLANVSGDVTFNYYTTNGTALVGSDYVAASGTITVPDGVSQTNITVVVNGTDTIGSNKTFALAVTNVSGATAFDNEGLCTITNNNARTISITPAVTVDPEGPFGTDTSAVFTVTLSGPAIGTDVTFQYDTQDGTAKAASNDYTAVSVGSGTIKAGTTQTNLVIVIKGDNTPEGVSENFRVVLSSPSANATLGTATGTCTIVDDDGLPTLSVADATVTEGNTGSADARFVVSINKAAAAAVTFDYQTADGTATAASGDYTLASGSGSIPAGALQTTVTVAVAGDYWIENDETFELRLGNLSANAEGFDTNAVGTILNDDYPFVWTGAGTNSLASNTNNWRWNGATATRLPAATDVVLLDGTSSSNLTWDAPSNGLPDAVVSWTQAATYGGTATVATLYAAQGTFTNVTVTGNLTVNGGVLTHGDNSTYGSGNTERYRLALTVGGDLTVGSGGRIDANGRGYASGQGPGGGNGNFAAASHGGQGGKYAGVKDGDYAYRSTYGSIRAPTRLGSGGGEAGSGGGAIQLTVGGATTVNGMILACGGFYRTGGNVKGGAGGSIWLRTGTLGGTNVLEASGGSPNRGADSSPGGGRVAVVVTNGGSVGSVACLAYGGAGTVDDVSHRGAAGTVYIETTNNAAGGGSLIVDNNNVANGLWTGASTLPAEAVDLASFAKVIVTNAGILAMGTNTTVNFGSAVIEGGGEVRIKSTNLVTFPGAFVLTNLYRLSLDVPVAASGNWTVANGGVLTHAPVHFANTIYSGTVDPATKLYLTLNGDLTVQPGGRIDVDGKGNGYTRGIGWQSGASQAGAAHGGCGGVNTPPLAPRTTYGSIREPYFHGSCGDYGAGGGVVRLVVSGATTIDGTVSANAADGGRTALTNGTGGSVWLRTGTLGGTGTVDALGGSIHNWFPCGGGGRIAVTVTNGATTGGVLFRALGGEGSLSGAPIGYTAINGAAGTVYLETQGMTPGKGQLLIDNNNLSCRYNNTNIAYTLIEASSSSAPALVKPVLVTITNRAQVKLNGSLDAAALSIFGNSYLELAGYTGTVSTLTITNGSIRVGTYAAAQLAPLVTDSSPGATGRMVVLGAFNGTVFKFR
jgi:hypothetical protein